MENIKAQLLEQLDSVGKIWYHVRVVSGKEIIESTAYLEKEWDKAESHYELILSTYPKSKGRVLREYELSDKYIYFNSNPIT